MSKRAKHNISDDVLLSDNHNVEGTNAVEQNAVTVIVPSDWDGDRESYIRDIACCETYYNSNIRDADCLALSKEVSNGFCKSVSSSKYAGPRAKKIMRYIYSHLNDYEFYNVFDRDGFDDYFCVQTHEGDADSEIMPKRGVFALHFDAKWFDEDGVSDDEFNNFFKLLKKHEISVVSMLSTKWHEMSYLLDKKINAEDRDLFDEEWISDENREMTYENSVLFHFALLINEKSYLSFINGEIPTIRSWWMPVFVLYYNCWYSCSRRDAICDLHTFDTNDFFCLNIDHFFIYKDTTTYFVENKYLMESISEDLARLHNDDIEVSHGYVSNRVLNFSSGRMVRSISSLDINTHATYMSYNFGLSTHDEGIKYDGVKLFMNNYADRFVAVYIDRKSMDVVVFAESNVIDFSSNDERFGILGSQFEYEVNRDTNIRMINAYEGDIDVMHYNPVLSVRGKNVIDKESLNKYRLRGNRYCFYVDKDANMIRFVKPVMIPAIDYNDISNYSYDFRRDYGFFDTTPVDIFLDIMLFCAQRQDAYWRILNNDRFEDCYFSENFERWKKIGIVCRDDCYAPKPMYQVIGYALGDPHYYDVSNDKSSVVHRNVSAEQSYDVSIDSDPLSKAMWYIGAGHMTGTIYIPIERYIAMLYDSGKYVNFSYYNKMHKYYNQLESEALETEDKYRDVFADKKEQSDLIAFFNKCAKIANKNVIDEISHDISLMGTDNNADGTMSNMLNSANMRFSCIFDNCWNLDFNEFYNYIKARVIGHDDEVKKACFYVYSYLNSLAHDDVVSKSNFMIAGISGCGKTEFMRAVKSYMKYKNLDNKIPVTKIDVTSATARGYKGDDIEDLVGMALVNGCDPWGGGIVFLDEIDKTLSAAKNVRSHDYFDSGVQYSLLTILEGTSLNIRLDSGNKTIHTDNTLFIGLGSFDFVRKRRENQAKSSFIGFVADANEADRMYWTDITKDDALEQGAHVELLGRFSTILNFRPLDDDSLRSILHKNVYERYSSKVSSPVSKIKISADAESKLIALGQGRYGVRGMLNELTSTMDDCLIDIVAKGETDRISSVTIRDTHDVKVNYNKKKKFDVVNAVDTKKKKNKKFNADNDI